jgi:hypothetical protein
VRTSAVYFWGISTGISFWCLLDWAVSSAGKAALG